MKNKMKLFGIIALVAIIGFGMTACDDRYADDPSTSGRLTITGLSNFTGQKLFVNQYYDETMKQPSFAVTPRNNPTSYDDIIIDGDSITLYIWETNIGDSGALKNYAGNKKNVKLTVTVNREIYNQTVNLDSPITVNFNKGKAAGVFTYNDAFTGTWIASEIGSKIVAEYKSFKIYTNRTDWGGELEITRGVYYVSEGSEGSDSVGLQATHTNRRDREDETAADNWISYDDLTEEEQIAAGSNWTSITLTGNTATTWTPRGDVIFTKSQ